MFNPQDGPYRIYGIASSVSTPPTPFADRETLEAELLAIEKEIGSIKLAKQRVAQDPEEISLTSLTMPDLTAADSDLPTGAVFHSLAAVRHLKSDSIDDFIANMAVPPPPTAGQQPARQVSKHSPVVELTKEDISAFIIPPPPGSEDERQQQIAQYRSRGPLQGDREVQELRVAREVRDTSAHRESSSSVLKIPTLQERIGLLKNQEQTRSMDMSLTLQKDRFGYPLKLSSQPQQQPTVDKLSLQQNHNSSRSDRQSSKYSHHQQQRGESASKELDATSPILKGGVQNKREMLLRQFGSPESVSKPIVKEHSDTPPPPPPRSSAPKSIKSLSQYNSNTLGKKVGSHKPKNLALGKSNSQDDMLLNHTSISASSAPVHKVHVKTMATKLFTKMSTSSEDLDTKRSPISPSKSMSLASSSDSISSTASVNTVKSVSPADDGPPSLPPRSSPSKGGNAPRLPVSPPVAPPLASPESSDIQVSKLVTNSPFRNGHLSPSKPENGILSPASSKSSLTSPPSVKSNMPSPSGSNRSLVTSPPSGRGLVTSLPSARNLVTSPPVVTRMNGISSPLSSSSSSSSTLSAVSPTKPPMKPTSQSTCFPQPPPPPIAPPGPPAHPPHQNGVVGVPGSPKPTLPARSTKPLSANHQNRQSPGRALPVVPQTNSHSTFNGNGSSRIKPAAPTPPSSPKPGNKVTNNHHHSPRSVPLSQRNGHAPAGLPDKAPQVEKLMVGRKLPVPPPTSESSPVPSHKFSSPSKSLTNGGKIIFIQIFQIVDSFFVFLFYLFHYIYKTFF